MSIKILSLCLVYVFMVMYVMLIPKLWYYGFLDEVSKNSLQHQNTWKIVRVLQ